MDLNIYIVLTFALGFLPPFLWLWFWVRGDAHPEPKKELVLVFLAGMVGVILAVILNKGFFNISLNLQYFFGYDSVTFQIVNVFCFAFVEEIAKLAAAFFMALKSKYFDEPVDAIIYMVTAALGFAALENTFFIADSLKAGIDQSIIVSSFRFANAVLLHVAASGIIGAGFAFSFFHKERRIKELIFAIIVATLLHSLYNLFIMKGGQPIQNIPSQFLATILVLIGATVSLLLFERAKELIPNKQNIITK